MFYRPDVHLNSETRATQDVDIATLRTTTEKASGLKIKSKFQTHLLSFCHMHNSLRLKFRPFSSNKNTTVDDKNAHRQDETRERTYMVGWQ